MLFKLQRQIYAGLMRNCHRFKRSARFRGWAVTCFLISILTPVQTFPYYFCNMKKRGSILIMLVVGCLLFAGDAAAQCSICTKTAQQLGENVGKGLNAGILYLAAAPMMILGYIGYRWYNSNKSSE